MSKTADKSHSRLTCHFPPLASSAVLPVEAPENMPTQTLAKATDGKTELIRELTRAKVAFQLRAIKAELGEVG